MTLTTLLSARIRDLESRAAPLPDYQEELAEIEQRRQQLHASIEGAQAAAYQLQLIGLHAEQVLNGTTTRVEITGGQEPLDEPTPEPEEAPKVPDVEPSEADPEAELQDPSIVWQGPLVVSDTPPAEEPEPVQELTISEQVLRHLRQHPGCSATQVAESTGLKLSSVAPALSALHRRGDLAHDGGKPMLYRLAGPAGPEAEEEPDPPAPLTEDQSHILGIFSDGGLYNESILQIRTKWAQTRVFRAMQALVMRGLVEKRHSSFVIVQQEQRATA